MWNRGYSRVSDDMWEKVSSQEQERGEDSGGLKSKENEIGGGIPDGAKSV